MFKDNEIAYLKTQRLARIATVSANGEPDVAPVGFDFDGDYFYIGGRNQPNTLKYKNVQINARVALVVDDLAPGAGWNPRGIKITGTADILQREGYAGSGAYLRIRPQRKRSWGLD